MKDSFILLIIILCGCGWVANKYVQKANTSSEQKTRFIELAEDYNDDAKLFLIEQAKAHHEEAFEASYRMWVLSPIAELDLSSYYDEKTYYRTLGKKIKQATDQSGQQDAYKMLLDMAKHYGVTLKTPKPAAKTPLGETAPKPQAPRESLLKSGKLGDKRTIPSSRKRYDDR